jgi:hypothetical protein
VRPHPGNLQNHNISLFLHEDKHIQRSFSWEYVQYQWQSYIIEKGGDEIMQAALKR